MTIDDEKTRARVSKRVDLDAPSHAHEAGTGAIVLTIPGYVPPGMNTLLRMHWAMYQRTKQDWYYLIMAALGRQHRNISYKKARVEMTMYRLGNMDRDNTESCFKLVGDSIKLLGIVPDDRPEYIETSVKAARVGKREEVKTVIVMREIGEKREIKREKEIGE